MQTMLLPPAVTVEGGGAGLCCLINHDRDEWKNKKEFKMACCPSCRGVDKSICGFGRVDYIYCHLFPSVDCFAYFFGNLPCALSLSPYVHQRGMAGRLAMTSKHEMDHSV